LPLLTAYWIKPPYSYAPLGIGVTARSIDDALAIVHAFGLGRYLTDHIKEMQIVEGITIAELDQFHVVPNMGPIVVRGMWYPFLEIGVSGWAEERIARSSRVR
jgi:hypothetical protein